MGGAVGGIILAGGQSRRMGTNKAFLRFDPEGLSLIEKVLNSLKRITAGITLVTNQPEEFSWLGLPMVGDNYRVGASLAAQAS